MKETTKAAIINTAITAEEMTMTNDDTEDTPYDAKVLEAVFVTTMATIAATRPYLATTKQMIAKMVANNTSSKPLAP